jgi:hypothetical protein
MQVNVKQRRLPVRAGYEVPLPYLVEEPATASAICHAPAGLLVAGRAGVAPVVAPVKRDLHGVQRRRDCDRRIGGSDVRV